LFATVWSVWLAARYTDFDLPGKFYIDIGPTLGAGLMLKGNLSRATYVALVFAVSLSVMGMEDTSMTVLVYWIPLPVAAILLRGAEWIFTRVGSSTGAL